MNYDEIIIDIKLTKPSLTIKALSYGLVKNLLKSDLIKYNNLVKYYKYKFIAEQKSNIKIINIITRINKLQEENESNLDPVAFPILIKPVINIIPRIKIIICKINSRCEVRFVQIFVQLGSISADF